MKKLLTLLLALPLLWGHAAAQENAKYTILLTGASFASPQNGWFEIGCRQLDARALNRAIGGESIADTANRMAEGTLWNAGELDEMDALVIMQVHNRDVSATGGLKEKYTDYTTPFDRSNYAAAFDYVIKRYQSECYALKDDPKSKYYGTKSGKPAVIVLCTDWHDARTTYNAAIRRPAAHGVRQEHRLLERHSEPGHRDPAEPAPRPGHANHRRRRLRVASPAGPRQIHPAADGCDLYRHDAQNPAGKIESRP